MRVDAGARGVPAQAHGQEAFPAPSQAVRPALHGDLISRKLLAQSDGNGVL